MRLKSRTIIEPQDQYDLETTNKNFVVFDNSETFGVVAHNSCIYPLYTPDGIILGTRAGVTDISIMAEKFITNSDIKYVPFLVSCFNGWVTPIFEFCSRKNRVVIDYPEDMLILTGIRDIRSGHYFPYSDMVQYAGMFGIPVVKAYESTQNGQFKNLLKQISELTNDEGIVIRFESGPNTGHMVKVKSSEYVLMHRTLDGLRFSKDIIKLALNSEIDDVYALLPPERKNVIQTYVDGFMSAMLGTQFKIDNEFEKFSHLESRKEFAEAIKNNKYKLFLFQMYGKEYDLTQMVKTFCLKACSSQTTLDEMFEFIGFDGKMD